MNLDRRQFLQSAGAAIAAAPDLLGQRPRRPNVLVVLADEWRAQATGYNGDRNVSAPVLDRQETESVNFANAVSGFLAPLPNSSAACHSSPRSSAASETTTGSMRVSSATSETTPGSLRVTRTSPTRRLRVPFAPLQRIACFSSSWLADACVLTHCAA